MLSPTVNNVTMRVLLIIVLITHCVANIIDAKGAFLFGHFEKREELFTEIL